MSEATTLAAALKSIDYGPAWHGPGIQELLGDITAEQAAAAPLDCAHSIWELVLHIAAWNNHARDILEGGNGDFTSSDRDWPKVPKNPTEDDWMAAKRKLSGGIQNLREVMVHCDDERLRQKVPGRDFPIKVLLHGVIHHNLYHLGQIALLKKAVNR